MKHKTSTKKVVFAAGGTGGHLFPAQALATQLQNQEIDIFFAGTGLKTSRYFDQSKFSFENIASATPFAGNNLSKLQSGFLLLRGIFQSILLLSKQRPDLVVGFGSFHAFPVICAAVFKRIPLVLFESNAIPGKVIRFFSRFSLFTAVYLKEAKLHLKAKTVDVALPTLKVHQSHSQEKSREHFNLDPQLFTLLVFGGSQGAKKINELLSALIPRLSRSLLQFQIIHLTGSEDVAEESLQLCRQYGVPCYAKPFESQMDFAWSAADLAICRAGAATLSEVIDFKIPSFLIPYPHAADQHQLKNARYIEKMTGGVKVFEENKIDIEDLENSILRLSASKSYELEAMKKSLSEYSINQSNCDFATLVVEALGK